MKHKLKLTYIFTHPIRWVAFEWLALYVDRSKFEVDFVILNENDPIVEFLNKHHIPVKTTRFLNYSDTSVVVKFIYDHLKNNQTDIVHTHFSAGDFTGIQAAFYANVPVRVFTRHHSGIKWKRYPRHHFELLWEMATDVVGLTEQGRQIMILDGIPEEKITVIPHGFDLEAFEKVSQARIEKLRHKYIPNHRGLVIGVMARYTKNKGIHFTIEAFKEVLKAHPEAVLILAGTGTKPENSHKNGIISNHDGVDLIQILLSELLPKNYVEIPFEEDLFALFRLFDVFVHVPTESDFEAFGQVYIEAMLSRVPSVITLSGVAHDYAVHLENAWVVDYKNKGQITEGILSLLENQSLREKIIQNGKRAALNYSIEKHVTSLENLYLKSNDKWAFSTMPELLEINQI